MKTKLTLKKVRAKNFRSIGNTMEEESFVASPSTLVVATENGSGKSTFFVFAPFFALFDKSYDGEKKATLVNSASAKDCLVEIEFETKGHSWLVRRGIKPNIFDIEKDGVRVEDEAALKDYQAYLVSILGMDEKMFCNSVILAADRFVPFTAMNPSERRAYVEPILDIGIFTPMNDITKTRLKLLKLKESDLHHKLDMGQSRIGNHERVIKLLEETIERKSADIGSQIAQIEHEIAESAKQKSAFEIEVHQNEVNKAVIEEDIKDRAIGLKSLNEALKESNVTASLAFESDRQKYKDLLDENYTSIEHYKLKIREYPSTLIADRDRNLKLIAQFETKIGMKIKTRDDFVSLDHCPTCTQAVSADTKAHQCDSLNPEIDKLQEALDKLKLLLSVIDVDIEYVDSLNALVKIHEDAARVSKESLLKFEFEVKDKIAESLKDQTDQINLLQTDIHKLEIEANTLEACIGNTRRMFQACDSQIRTYQGQIFQIQKQAEDGGEKAKLETEATELYKTRIYIDTLTIEFEQCIKDIKTHNQLLLMLKDDAAKAQIVKQYIPFLNQKINAYLDKMGMFLNISMNEEYEISMFSPDRKGQALGSLSAGQSKRVDLSVLFAWRDVAMLKSSVSCNVLVLDEVLESLSEEGVRSFMSFWESEYNAAGDTNLAVISQRNAEFSEYFERVITYSLKDGRTIRIE